MTFSSFVEFVAFVTEPHSYGFGLSFVLLCLSHSLCASCTERPTVGHLHSCLPPIPGCWTLLPLPSGFVLTRHHLPCSIVCSRSFFPYLSILPFLLLTQKEKFLSISINAVILDKIYYHVYITERKDSKKLLPFLSIVIFLLKVSIARQLYKKSHDKV